MSSLRAFLVGLGLLGAATLGCSSNSPAGPAPAYVGAACTSNSGCAQVCGGGDLAGMCTLACASDLDCPPGASCVDEHGGLCAIDCSVSANCAGYPGNSCGPKPRVGASGNVNVCRHE